VPSAAFTNAIVILYAVSALLGALLYLPFRVAVRVELHRAGHWQALGLFELKEQWREMRADKSSPIPAAALAPAQRSPSETREIVLQCGPSGWTVRFNPATRIAYIRTRGFNPYRSHATREARYLVFQIDPSEMMRIDLEALVN
jgi:hypothetical protein